MALVGLFVLAPGNEDARLAAILHGICAQRPSHSLGPTDHPMVLEARMYGIFAGFAATVALGWLRGGWRRTRLPRGWQLALMLAFVAALAIDGLNALRFDAAGAALYTPRTDARLFTGLLCGLAMAAFIAPAVSEALWKDREDLPLFASVRELGLALLVVAVLGAVSLSGLPPTTLLSVVAVVAVLGSFWIVNVHFCVLAWDGSAGAARWTDLQRYALLGFGLSVAELVGLALLRGWSEAALGVHWVV